MRIYIVNKLLNTCFKRYSTSMTIIHKPPELSSKLETTPMDSLTLNDLLTSDIKTCNTKSITDILYSSAYKYENSIRHFDNSVYRVSQSQNLEIFYLYLLSKAPFLKHDQMIPFIRSYDIFQLSILNDKCWQIIGRILNNCINLYTDNELVEICYHLSRISSIPDNTKELEIFWQRVVIQSPNWFDNLHKFDILSLIHLLHICRNKPFEIDYIDRVIDAIKNTEDLYYTIDDLSIVSFLIDVMGNNRIFDGQLVENSAKLISIAEVNAQFLSNQEHAVDFVGLIWNYSRLVMTHKDCKSCLDRIDLGKLCSIAHSMGNINEKLSIKLTKSLYLLGVSIDDLPSTDIDVKLLDDVHESEIIDSIYTIELAKDSRRFLERYSPTEYAAIDLPCSMKSFHLLNERVDWAPETAAFREYLCTVAAARQSLSEFVTVRPTASHELILEYANSVIAVVPCEVGDFVCPAASDGFVSDLREKYQDLAVYKVGGIEGFVGLRLMWCAGGCGRVGGVGR